MAFQRVNPSGWPFGGKLTSAQQNQLDINVSNALDKTVAGDTLAGVVGMGASAAVLVNTPGAKIVSSVLNGIQGTVNQAIVANGNGCIVSLGANGGFWLAGGASDYPQFSPARTINRTRPLRASTVIPSAWNSSNQYYLIGSAATGFIFCDLDGLIDGALLQSVSFQFIVTGTHAGGVGGGWVPPAFTIFRQPVSNGSSLGLQTLNSGDSGGGISPSPASGATWHNGGLVQGFQYTVNQNGIVDLKNFVYGIAIQDENGANSNSGNSYFATLSSMIVAQLAYD